MIKKIGLLMLITISLQSVKASYSEHLVDKRYRQALNAGCEDLKVKNPATAIVLGLLPGGGSFYTGEIGLGIADLILWPFSPIWDMPLAGKKAVERNKSVTIENCEDLGRIKRG
jgi:hypothetical protein